VGTEAAVETQAHVLADAVTDLGRLAMAFGRINRTACWHPEGDMRESDSDHTVMLGWIAPALAHALYHRRLSIGLVAEYALVHDAVEVFAGDTPTLRITGQGRADKAERERTAADEWELRFWDRLPWITGAIRYYEAQLDREARFVRAVDKCLPKIVHLLDGARGLIEEGMTPGELREIFERQAADMAEYAGEFTALMDLRAELVARTIALLEEASGAS
jgi:putative hydrolases of HD superfamily